MLAFIYIYTFTYEIANDRSFIWLENNGKNRKCFHFLLTRYSDALYIMNRVKYVAEMKLVPKNNDVNVQNENPNARRRELLYSNKPCWKVFYYFKINSFYISRL